MLTPRINRLAIRTATILGIIGALLVLRIIGGVSSDNFITASLFQKLLLIGLCIGCGLLAGFFASVPVAHIIDTLKSKAPPLLGFLAFFAGIMSVVITVPQQLMDRFQCHIVHSSS